MKLFFRREGTRKTFAEISRPGCLDECTEEGNQGHRDGASGDGSKSGCGAGAHGRLHSGSSQVGTVGSRRGADNRASLVGVDTARDEGSSSCSCQLRLREAAGSDINIRQTLKTTQV
jgi:hypothetical protein